MNFHKNISAFLLVIFYSFASSAQFFLHDEGNLFVDKKAAIRTLGIEIEFSGLSDDQIIALMRQHLGAVEVPPPVKPRPLQRFFKTKLGLVSLQVEGSAWKYENQNDNKQKFNEQLQNDFEYAPREIAFPPLALKDMRIINDFFYELKANGAQGTSETSAVSLQVNIGMNPIKKSQKAREDLLNLMRVYYNEEHARQAKQLLKVPANREMYLQSYSKGFLEKLKDENYLPSARQLYDDYFYRQIAELMNIKNAWSMPIQEARQIVLAAGETPALIRVAKMNRLRVSSLILDAFPNETLTRYLVNSRWSNPAPLVEFREFNNDFNVIKVANMALGVVRASELFGNYSHDELISSLTGVSEEDLQRLREELGKKKIVRYTLLDPSMEEISAEDRTFLRYASPGTIQIQVAPDKVGLLPLKLPEGAILWHRRHIQKNTLQAEHMPGLENPFLQAMMENKIFESYALAKYAPKAMPDFIRLKTLKINKSMDPRDVWKKLNTWQPQGWVLKGAWDLASEKSIITDQIDIDKAMTDYENGFEEYRKQVIAENPGTDPEWIIYLIKFHPGYLGWKIKQVLARAEIAFAQKRVNIKTEIRVEVIGGHVLGNGSTIDRYAYEDELSGKTTRKRLNNKILRAAERFTQSVVDQFPDELRILPYAFDVALLSDGTWTVIETNSGGNSGFLEWNPRSSLALAEYLGTYPKFSNSQRGRLNEAEQMQWIKDRLNEFHIDAKSVLPEFVFKKTDLKDKEFKTIEPKEKFKKGCAELLTGLPKAS